MEEELEVILRAVDEASDTFESVTNAAENMGESVQGGAEQGSQGLDEMQESASTAEDPLEQISSIISGLAGAEIFNQLAEGLWDVADKAGNFEDSLMRARLEAEGAGIDVNAMTDAVSQLSSETGRAGGEIRESFIKATARGITDIGSFKSMMEGAGAQATLLGTDITTMADKMSGMAMRSSVMERTLANTGITVEELGNALGIQGATIDDVNAKWATMDTNQRAAALGMAASMNEGQTANEEYKKSWAGLQAQIDIAKGRLERLAGEVLLPVLVPALEVAGRVLNWLGDTISAVMNGPLGGIISVAGAVVAGFALLVPAIMAVQGAMTLFEASLLPAIGASWALMAPWLPWIALGAAIVAVIYEIGKAFGWWDDASGMIDAIGAGLNRLWEAFINNPDVQAFIQAMNEAWTALSGAVQPAIDAVLSFFGVNLGGNFDIVRALIDAIGFAWNAITAPIRLVIGLIWQVISVFQSLVSGQISLQQAIVLIWGAITGFWRTILNKIAGLLLSAFTRMVNNARQKAQAIVTGVITSITTLPGKMTTQLLKGVTSIVNAGGKWVSNAKTQAGKVVSGVNDKLSGIGGSITSALSGVVNAFTKPFKDAYSAVADWVGKIKDKASEVPVIGGAFGGEDLPLGGAYGGEDLTSTQVKSIEKREIHTTNDVNLNLDLRNVPAGIDETLLHNLVIDTLTDKSVLSVLVNNNDFQSLDNRAKARILARNNRARGV